MTVHIRWQVLLISASIVLLVVLVAYLALNFTTVVVPDRGGTYIEALVGIPQFVNPILSQYNQVDQDLVSLVFDGLTQVNKNACVKCMLCVKNCPHKAIDEDINVDPEKCIHCGACEQICPVNAIKVWREFDNGVELGR